MRLLPLLHRLGLPYDVTLHDTYFLTPNPMFVHAKGARSRPGLDRAMQDAMSEPLNGPLPDETTLAGWCESFAPVLRGAGRLIAPSQFIARTFQSFHPELRIMVAPNLETERLGLPLDVPPLGPDGVMTVAVLGDISPHKGLSNLMRCAIRARVRGLPLQFVVIGSGTIEPMLRSAGIAVHGAYDDDSLPRLLQRYRAHAIWYPYLAPESYNYTLTVGLLSGLPIAATDAGCFPERLAGAPQAIVLPVETEADSWLGSFEQIRARIAAGGVDSAPARPEPDTFYALHYLDPFMLSAKRAASGYCPRHR